jgi:hypothetical protein
MPYLRAIPPLITAAQSGVASKVGAYPIGFALRYGIVLRARGAFSIIII